MRDSRIQTAIDNWAPRFIANGADMNDFFRITGGITSWSEWCSAWTAVGAEHAALAEDAEDKGFLLSAGEHLFRAAITYHFGKFLYFVDMDQHRAAHQRVVSLYRRALPYFSFPSEAVSVPYENGDVIPAIVRKPLGVDCPPVVILVPGLDSVKEENHLAGEDCLRRGMAVISIDGPGQGELEESLTIRPDYEVPIRYVIDYLETRDDLDAGRVGLFGRSLGGYYAARAAAREPRLKGAVALAPGYRIAEDFETMPGLTREAFTYHLHASDQAVARSMLEAFDLESVIPDLQCPLLVIMGGKDRIFSPAAVEGMVAASGGRAELLMFADGNHGCNNIAYKYRPAQSDWMWRKLAQGESEHSGYYGDGRPGWSSGDRTGTSAHEDRVSRAR